ncbi:hypothetical protein CERZMDRAFT_90643 [Cercospora zeae-maydis SCOH1-5]|uniref:Uncharacterized protein n=1 Tax=Cercospora zeae-maydis SCOH1-5 TaxID=717836 RepID=A0A6A6FGR3_9PEZI|nr:hypothetical protein CERZMDRAFT_90643 [Cercospora zeae-maydis SCOH1-5]
MSYSTAPPETFNIAVTIPLDRQTINAIKSGFFDLDGAWSQSKYTLAAMTLRHTTDAVKALPDLPPEASSSSSAANTIPAGPFQLIVQDANGKRLPFVFTGQEAVQEIALRVSMQTRITKKRMQLWYKGVQIYCGLWQGEEQKRWLRNLQSVRCEDVADAV